jgi:hypothetical protein
LSSKPPFFLDEEINSQNGDATKSSLPFARIFLYGSLALAETIFWYWLAPGIDPDSRWFAPADRELVSTLLNPAIATAPPTGSGLGFSSLLLNSFLILPSVWSLLLLQEDGPCTPGKRQIISPFPFCAAGFFVGGGALIPYMVVREPRPLPEEVNPSRFPAPLKWFEEGPIGPAVLVALTVLVLTTFATPFLCSGGAYNWTIEWNAFLDRIQSSQFSALAVFDLTMLSFTILDPMMDDARRRRFLNDDDGATTTTMEAISRLAPYMFPLLGPVAWICLRPKYNTTTTTNLED